MREGASNAVHIIKYCYGKQRYNIKGLLKDLIRRRQQIDNILANVSRVRKSKYYVSGWAARSIREEYNYIVDLTAFTIDSDGLSENEDVFILFMILSPVNQKQEWEIRDILNDSNTTKGIKILIGSAPSCRKGDEISRVRKINRSAQQIRRRFWIVVFTSMSALDILTLYNQGCLSIS